MADSARSQIVVHSEDEPLDVVSRAALTLDLSPVLHAVEIRFEPATRNGELAADTLLIQPTGPQLVSRIVAASFVRGASHLPLSAGHRVVRLLLAPGSYTANASSHAGSLRPTDGRYQATELGRVMFIVEGSTADTVVVEFPLEEPPGDEELR